jgi:pimeloyl-ACP methyl ester carboxylesterase
MTSNDNSRQDPEGFLMSYEDSADRVPVLWIHGFPLNAQLWDLQIEGLADIARQITPDLRGHGKSDSTPPPCTMEMYADDCVRLLDNLGCHGPVVVGGLSMGGYVAMELCRRHPERVLGLILAATRAGADSAEGKAGRDQAAEVARKDGVAAIVEGMLPKLMAPQTYKEQPDLVEFVKDMMMETSEDGVIGALAGMRDRVDSTPDLAEFPFPTLIIHGQDDQLIPVSEAQAMLAAMPEADLVIIPEAGHLPNLEQANEFNDAVRDFLDQYYDG